MSASAKIVRKIVFKIPLRVDSPLRIASGSTDGLTDILVLKNKKGEAFIPGTSMAGVLRSAIAGLYDVTTAEVLFGNAEEDGNQSCIMIRDVILQDTDIIIRDGVAIDPISGTGKDKGKYDFEAVERNAHGELNMEITIREKNRSESFIPLPEYRHEPYYQKGDMFGELAATLADLLTQGVRVGSLTSKGFGRVKSETEASFFEFNFTEGRDAEAWMRYLEKGELPQAAYTSSKIAAQHDKNSFVIKAMFSVQSSLLVRDAEAAEDYVADNTVSAVQMRSCGDYVIPGTSVKGALRSKALKILLAVSGNQRKKAERFIDRLMGTSGNTASEDGKKSRLLVDETYIAEKDLFEMEQTRNRIDRFTGGTVDNALFTEVPVWQRSKGVPVVTVGLEVTHCSAAEAGLMLLLLKELWLGNLPLGGGKAVGRGTLRGIQASIYFGKKSWQIQDDRNQFAVEGDRNMLESYVTALAGEMHG